MIIPLGFLNEMDKKEKWFAYGDSMTGFKGSYGVEVEAVRMGNSPIWWITKSIYGVETEHCTYSGDMHGVMEFMEERYGDH